MPGLVAIDLPGGPDFVVALRRIWDAGHVALPVDQRLPDHLRDELLRRFGVGAVIGPGDRVAPTPIGHEALEDGDALVVATSGSSGEPKGAVLTHDAVAASAAATSKRLGVTGDDHWLACLPLSHVGGLSVVTRALHTGTRLTVHPRFDPAAAEASGATLVSLVTAALRRIDASCFRVIVLGGAAPPSDRPANTVTTYGMTETGSGIVYDGVALDHVDLRIVDDEIHVRGPMLLRRYLHAADPFLAGGWFPTGDLGELRDGRLVVAGRRGDLIITGGENVWPEQVEAVLRTHPGVLDVGVTSTPDAEWGALVTAVVVPTDPDDPVELDALRDWARSRLPAHCAPRRVVVAHALPRSSLGKLRRAELAERAR